VSPIRGGEVAEMFRVDRLGILVVSARSSGGGVNTAHQVIREARIMQSLGTPAVPVRRSWPLAKIRASGVPPSL